MDMARVGQWAVDRVVTEVLYYRLLRLEADLLHLLQDNLRGSPGLRKRVWPCISKHRLPHHAVFITRHDLQRVGGWSSCRASNANLIGANLFHAQGGHIYIDIRGHIVARIMHLV